MNRILFSVLLGVSMYGRSADLQKTRFSNETQTPSPAVIAASPYGDVFEDNAGRYFVLAVGSDKHFKALCSCIGMPELGSDPLFLTNPDRLQNRAALLQKLASIFKGKSVDHWMHLLKENDVPAGMIRNMKELFELEIAREKILQYSDNPNHKTLRSVAFKIY